MKKLSDLSKQELLGFITNYDFSKNKEDGYVDIHAEVADCVVCGDNQDFKYGYCCDECNKHVSDCIEEDKELT